MKRAEQMIMDLSIQLEEYKADSIRYNYLRTELGYVIGNALKFEVYCSPDDKLPFDYKIDAAMQTQLKEYEG